MFFQIQFQIRVLWELNIYFVMLDKWESENEKKECVTCS